MDKSQYVIDEYLKEYLINSVSLERYTSIVEMLNNVDSLNRMDSSIYYLDITELESDLLNIARDDENLGNNTIIVMEKVILSRVSEYLEHIGIFLNGDTTFNMLGNVILGLYSILDIAPENTYEIESIIIDDEHDITSKLACLLSSFSMLNEHQYMNIIEDIDIDLYSKIMLLMENKKESIKLNNDDMSVINFITNINKDYENTMVVSKLRRDGYSDQMVIEYLEPMYTVINTSTNVTLAALEVAATFYLGSDSRYSMFTYYDLYFNPDAVINQNIDHTELFKKINENMIEIENKV